MDTQHGSDEAAFLAAYDSRAYTPTAVTVDIAALTIRAGRLCVLLVQRANHPFRGMWCLPGGFLVPDEQGSFPALDVAAAARLALETGLALDDAAHGTAALRTQRVHIEQLGTFGAPGRDPRMHVISVAHLAFAPDLPDPVAGPDTLAAVWLPVDEALAFDLAFDHTDILAAALDRARAKLEYTTLATAFLPAEFTIAELQGVYETVWGERLVTPGFRRKVHATPGFVEPANEMRPRRGDKGGRRAQMYRAGAATLLMPPIISDETRQRAGATTDEPRQDPRA